MTFESLYNNTSDLDEETRRQVFIQKMLMHQDRLVAYAKTLQPHQKDLLLACGEVNHFNEEETLATVQEAGLYFD